MPKTSTITLGVQALEITRDPIIDNQMELFNKDQINNVSGTFNQKPITATLEEWGYAYNTMTNLQIKLTDGTYFSIELQKVSNQPTWSTGLLTGLQQAIADINAWL